ncbi:Cysteine-rich transmembrane CYSTM domain-containing protein [Caenorhabditis elegans]|uniref:Cysteine-rich transmembrane CYSTM domain-containing protein n=1 Tax=Caenorhabditis elegans TaxID=6239 RepID=B5BM44_CAEEL|nr:Cysteine-rich transmembrane CYSTM domain-containing protein [Caenorhabditis elegans]CAR31503.1 Cysteine-rich transmembrane CYSTM domain-containing protein [Caenorhabditis elegans]|eukprot:NP_001129912.1 Uncharacterized protein CELE_W06G6.17 [Caenorhabditis elegans]
MSTTDPSGNSYGYPANLVTVQPPYQPDPNTITEIEENVSSKEEKKEEKRGLCCGIWNFCTTSLEPATAEKKKVKPKGKPGDRGEDPDQLLARFCTPFCKCFCCIGYFLIHIPLGWK